MNTMQGELEEKARKRILLMMNILVGGYTLKMLLDMLQSSFDRAFGFQLFVSEFLINYAGGFVRRGLTGEIIYRLSLWTGINPLVFIIGVSFICFIAVVVFFVYQFRKHHILWWILPLTICFGNTYIIRKDYLFILNLILILYTYRSDIKPAIKYIIINTIAIFTILSHESFFFMCAPLIGWMLIREKRSGTDREKAISMIACLPMIISMVYVCIYHGDRATAEAIQASWEPISNGQIQGCNLDFAEKGNYVGSVGALTWQTGWTFQHHIYSNFIQSHYGIPGWIIRIVLLVLSFYYIINYVGVLSDRTLGIKTDFNRSYLIQLTVFLFLSNIPLFTVLSNDTSRIYQYWTASVFCFYLLIGEKDREDMFPKWYQSVCKRFTQIFDKIAPPRYWAMIVLTLTLGISCSGNFLLQGWNSSVLGEWMRIVYVSFKMIMGYL